VGEKVPSPLQGKRVVITRAAEQSATLEKELSARGAIPEVVPLVAFAEPEDFSHVDAALASLDDFDWMIFTSAQAVRSLTRRAERIGKSREVWKEKPWVACVGPATATAAREAGFLVEFVARTHNGVGLAGELGGRLKGAKILLPRSDRANPDLPAELQRQGADSTEVVAYRTLKSSLGENSLKKITEGEADAILFFSPSAVHHFSDLFGRHKLRSLQDKLVVAAVGPVTANALREAGVQRMLIAPDTTSASVIEALEERFGATLNQAQAGAKRA
jgi:uroporphyrinogen-III synthase